MNYNVNWSNELDSFNKSKFKMLFIQNGGHDVTQSPPTLQLSSDPDTTWSPRDTEKDEKK